MSLKHITNSSWVQITHPLAHLPISLLKVIVFSGWPSMITSISYMLHSWVIHIPISSLKVTSFSGWPSKITCFIQQLSCVQIKHPLIHVPVPGGTYCGTYFQQTPLPCLRQWGNWSLYTTLSLHLSDAASEEEKGPRLLRPSAWENF